MQPKTTATKEMGVRKQQDGKELIPTEEVLAEFDAKLDGLIELGVPEAMGFAPVAFRNQIAPLREILKGQQIWVTPGNKILAIVLPERFVSLAGQLKLLFGENPSFQGQFGEISITPNTISPASPYVIVDVDATAKTSGFSPGQMNLEASREHRKPLDLLQAVAVATQHAQTVEGYQVMAAASDFGTGFTPVIRKEDAQLARIPEESHLHDGIVPTFGSSFGL